MVNVVTIGGTVRKEPTVQVKTDGKWIASFLLTNKAASYSRSKTFRVQAFDALAKYIEKNLHLNDVVLVNGYLDSYINAKKQYCMYIQANSITNFNCKSFTTTVRDKDAIEKEDKIVEVDTTLPAIDLTKF